MYSDSDTEFIKIVMLGESKVGKTSLSERFVKNSFDEEQKRTIDAYYLEKKVEVAAGFSYKVSVWDTAGQEEFSAMMPMYYRNAVGAILVYDISILESFERVHKWIRELKSLASQDIVLLIVGNKCDLENLRQIDYGRAERYAKEVGAFHFTASAKSAKGVQELFQFLIKEIYKRKIKKKNKPKNNFPIKSSLKIKGERSDELKCCN